jgi:hypothetical protein
MDVRKLVRWALALAVVAAVVAAFAIPIWAASGGGGSVERAPVANGSSGTIAPAASPGIHEIPAQGP